MKKETTYYSEINGVITEIKSVKHDHEWFLTFDNEIARLTLDSARVSPMNKEDYIKFLKLAIEKLNSELIENEE